MITERIVIETTSSMRVNHCAHFDSFFECRSRKEGENPRFFKFFFIVLWYFELLILPVGNDGTHARKTVSFIETDKKHGNFISPDNRYWGIAGNGIICRERFNLKERCIVRFNIPATTIMRVPPEAVDAEPNR